MLDHLPQRLLLPRLRRERRVRRVLRHGLRHRLPAELDLRGQVCRGCQLICAEGSSCTLWSFESLSEITCLSGASCVCGDECVCEGEGCQEATE